MSLKMNTKKDTQWIKLRVLLAYTEYRKAAIFEPSSVGEPMVEMRRIELLSEIHPHHKALSQ